LDSPTGRSLTGLRVLGLILAAILTSAFAMQQSTTNDWATVRPSFVVDFTSLLLLGPNATLLVAAAGTGTRGLAEAQRPQQYFRMLMTAAIVMASTQAAGLAHQALGGTMGHFVWPWQGVPIGAALVAYCLVKSALAEVVVPLCARQPVNRSWANSLLQNGPSYFIGASLAVGLVEVIDHQVWRCCRSPSSRSSPIARIAQLNQLEEQQRRREVIDALDQACRSSMATSRHALNDTLNASECPRHRAVNQTVAALCRAREDGASEGDRGGPGGAPERSRRSAWFPLRVCGCCRSESCRCLTESRCCGLT
jgi:hypothetical protein